MASTKSILRHTELLQGFVDVQVNGYKGTSFTPTAASGVGLNELRSACRAYLHDAAVVAFVPTMVTSNMATYRRVLPQLASLVEEDEFRGRIPAIHLEGPFISAAPGAVGAHDANSVVAPNNAVFDELQRLARGHIRMITIAADVVGATELCRHCSAAGERHSLCSNSIVAPVAVCSFCC